VRPTRVRSKALGKPFLRRLAAAALLSTTAVGVAVTAFGTGGVAQAQTLAGPRNPNAQLLLKADTLTYDNDAEIVTATGDVQLDYDGYNVVADRVSYNQKTQRVKAFGNVEIIEPDGNKIYAQEIDLTDDFAQGFVNALRVETPDNTRFAAESAERFAGQKTVFHHGVYTACEPCKEKPDKAPVWQVRAEKVILNGVEKTVTYRNAKFEFLGVPIAFLPYFSHADPSVKRKTGFLIPRIGYAKELGYWYSQGFFIETGDTHDLTLTATGYSRQGILAQARWRHQLENGYYELEMGGINQRERTAFTSPPDSTEDKRGYIATKGEFKINPRWTFGWRAMRQTDLNFARTYEIEGYSGVDITNQVYLRGLANKSYFDLSAREYLVQSPTTTFGVEELQPTVLPVLDYNTVKTSEATGGEVTMDVNVVRLDRNRLDTRNTAVGADLRVVGAQGEYSRASVDVGWRKVYYSQNGLTFNPFLNLRADAVSTSVTAPADASSGGTLITQGSEFRFMPTAGLQVSYPLLARMGGSSHIFEPTAQLLLRPDLNFNGVLPNEDAQSLVFDTTNLFSPNKFSGYDRIEGGTRANLGIRYAGQFDNGLALNAMVGQSFHLGGRNPYAREDDVANVGEESGLETNRSDYVASFGFSTAGGFSAVTQARFDESSFELRRLNNVAAYATPEWSVALNYTFIEAQPDYSFNTDRRQVGLSASYKLTEYWRAYGALQYDLINNALVSDSIGISYNDECFSFSLAFSETRSRYTDDASNKSINFRFSFRTVGDFEGSIDPESISGL